MTIFQQDTPEKLFQLLSSFHIYSKGIEKQMELTQERLQILMTLVLQGPKTINQLAEDESVSAPAITRTVKGLEKQGYVIKSRSKTDQRVVYVAPTRKSQQTIETIRSQQKKYVSELLKAVKDTELSLVGESLDVLLKKSNKIIK